MTQPNEVDEGAEVEIVYDSPQSDTPVSKTGEVANVGTNSIRIKRSEDYYVTADTRRDRVTSSEPDEKYEFVHLAELGDLVEINVLETAGDDEDAQPDKIVRSAIAEVIDKYDVQTARDAVDSAQDILDPEPRADGGQAFDTDGETTYETQIADEYFPEGTVEIIAEEDGWYVLDGDTYDAKGQIKGATNYPQRDFDGDRKVWLVKIDAFEPVHERLNEAGYLVVDERDAPEPEPEPEPAERLQAHIDETAEGDRIEVEYEMKNGNGTNSKEGVIEKARLPDEEYRKVPQLVFIRDDGQRMYVEPDEYGKLALYTSMSHAPYVGDVTTVYDGDGEPLPEPSAEADETDDAPDATDASDLPWNGGDA